MDLHKLSKPELLTKCQELGIVKCQSKSKAELHRLIDNKNIIKTPPPIEIDTIDKFLEQCVF
jgi:hypothetical protein